MRDAGTVFFLFLSLFPQIRQVRVSSMYNYITLRKQVIMLHSAIICKIRLGMRLFDKIDWFYKRAQQSISPSQIIANSVQNIVRQIGRRNDISSQEKEQIISSLQEPLKQHKPLHVDASWGACLAAIIDRMNGTISGTENPELKEFYRGLCNLLRSTWDIIEKSGHKAHVDKPVPC